MQNPATKIFPTKRKASILVKPLILSFSILQVRKAHPVTTVHDIFLFSKVKINIVQKRKHSIPKKITWTSHSVLFNFCSTLGTCFSLLPWKFHWNYREFLSSECVLDWKAYILKLYRMIKNLQKANIQCPPPRKSSLVRWSLLLGRCARDSTEALSL